MSQRERSRGSKGPLIWPLGLSILGLLLLLYNFFLLGDFNILNLWPVLLVILGDWAHGRRIVELDGRLQLRKVRDEPRLTAEVIEEQAAVLLDERSRLVEAARQLLFRLGRDRDVDVVDRDANGQHRQRGARKEDAVGQR